MVNSHCGFTSPDASEITDAIERAYSKMTEEERVEIDRIGGELKKKLEEVYLTHTGRKNTHIGIKASRELLGKIGIWMIENNSKCDFVVVDNGAGQELEMC